MLQDKDRIFTNLYGIHDWGLEGAREPPDHGSRGLLVVEAARLRVPRGAAPQGGEQVEDGALGRRSCRG